jgi:hypothetical protein
VQSARETVLLGDAWTLRDRGAMRPEDAVQWWLRNGNGRERSDDGEILDTTLERLSMGLDALALDDALPGGAGTGGARHDRIESDIVDLEELVDTSKPSLTFLEIALRDDDGYPIGDEMFEVDLPDGRTWTGQLDTAGCARVDDIPRGHCVVRFPRLAAA